MSHTLTETHRETTHSLQRDTQRPVTLPQTDTTPHTQTYYLHYTTLHTNSKRRAMAHLFCLQILPPFATIIIMIIIITHNQ